MTSSDELIGEIKDDIRRRFADLPNAAVTVVEGVREEITGKDGDVRRRFTLTIYIQSKVRPKKGLH